MGVMWDMGSGLVTSAYTNKKASPLGNAFLVFRRTYVYVQPQTFSFYAR